MRRRKKAQRNSAPKHIRPKMVRLVKDLFDVDPDIGYDEVERIQQAAYGYKIGRKSVTEIKREKGLTGPYTPRSPKAVPKVAPKTSTEQYLVVRYEHGTKQKIMTAVKKAGGKVVVK